jgi:hypothetical protein
MNPIVVVIPTRYYVDMIEDLLPSLTEASKIYIYDNGLSTELYDRLESHAELTMINAYGSSIYKMWNDGWSLAQLEFENPYVAILNDDIYFLPGTLELMAKALNDNPSVAAICPEYERRVAEGISDNSSPMIVSSTFGNRGMAGFAFMLKGELPIVKIDENYNWWYGDDELVWNIEHAGYWVAKLLGVPVDHNQGRSSRQDDTIAEKINMDRIYFNQKYGENR